MIAVWKKARTWLLGSLLTLLGFSSCEKPGADMYGPPPMLMYGPPPPQNGYQARSEGEPSKAELVETVTPETDAPEVE